MKVNILVLTILVLSSNLLQAQLFKKLTNRVQDKIERKIEDRVVEEVSDRIANAAMRPIDNALNEMFKKQYKETYGKEYDASEYEDDPEARAAMMQSVFSSLYGNLDLPPSYNFSYTMEIEIKDEEKIKMQMLFDPENHLMAFDNLQDAAGDNYDLVVMDMKNDQVVMLNREKKTAFGLSNVMKMASGFASSDEYKDQVALLEFEKINKTKKFAGYQSEGYKYKTKENEGTMYMTTELPFDYTDLYGGVMAEYAKQFYRQNPDYDIKGMMMYAKSKDKNGDESSWEVKNISTKPFSIDCSDYSVGLPTDM